MRQQAPDGSLLSWSDLEEEYEWRVLLLGNGLSTNVWKPFRYRSLYKKAIKLHSGGLSAQDIDLFTALDTQNFETVLGDLNSSIQVLTALKQDPALLLERYQCIQAALGEAIRAVHVPWGLVPDGTLGVIQQVLHQYEWVFTTSYDLLLYWAMGHDEDYGDLVDLLWGPSCSFDPKDTDIRIGSVPLFFLHGAMHLIVEGNGRTRKLKRTTSDTLLDQFGKPIEGDPQARPLLVTEGSSAHKLQAIESNDYLAHAFKVLQAPYLDCPMVVFGSHLGEEDRHITDALSVHSHRPVAISMMPDEKRKIRSKQGDIFGRVEAEPLLFYDATTFPLGSASLAAPPVRPIP